ncbi:MAG: hypothetical protein ACPIOQ_61950, partial [Promethearchaeia archaeon]
MAAALRARFFSLMALCIALAEASAAAFTVNAWPLPARARLPPCLSREPGVGWVSLPPRRRGPRGPHRGALTALLKKSKKRRDTGSASAADTSRGFGAGAGGAGRQRDDGGFASESAEALLELLASGGGDEAELVAALAAKGIVVDFVDESDPGEAEDDLLSLAEHERALAQAAPRYKPPLDAPAAACLLSDGLAVLKGVLSADTARALRGAVIDCKNVADRAEAAREAAGEAEQEDEHLSVVLAARGSHGPRRRWDLKLPWSEEVRAALREALLCRETDANDAGGGGGGSGGS